MADRDLNDTDSDSPAKAGGGVGFQRHVTRLVLEQKGAAGFALAGSSAIREHGLTERPTNDVDLFATSVISPQEFAAAVAATMRVLEAQGFRVTQTRSTPEFGRLLVQTPEELAVEVDLGIDWREEPPVQLAIGPVLALHDAVGSKIAAVYSRGEVRDYLDLDSIRQSGRFTDVQLTTLATEHDPGFDMAMFAQRLRGIAAFGAIEVSEYNVSPQALHAIKQRLLAWATELEPPSDRYVTPYRAPDVAPDVASDVAQHPDAPAGMRPDARPALRPPTTRRPEDREPPPGPEARGRTGPGLGF